MMKLKNALWAAVALALLYACAWLFVGEHGYTYYIEPAKKVGTEWTCPPDEDGPITGEVSYIVCHDPVRQCPSLWFPVATQVPCGYKDPLGGPYTKADLLVLEQINHQKR